MCITHVHKGVRGISNFGDGREKGWVAIGIQGGFYIGGGRPLPYDPSMDGAPLLLSMFTYIYIFKRIIIKMKMKMKTHHRQKRKKSLPFYVSPSCCQLYPQISQHPLCIQMAQMAPTSSCVIMYDNISFYNNKPYHDMT